MIGVAIFILIIGAITLFSRNLWVYNAFIGNTLEGVNSARVALKTMTAEIRTASSGNNGAYAISLATATNFIFYSDIDDNGLKEKVEYVLSGTTLQKKVTVPTGSPLAYTGTPTTTTLVSNIPANGFSFSYYDRNYDGTTAALAFPVDISSIRLVKINISIEKDPNRSPTPINLSTQVTLRNIKDNL